MIDKLKEFVNSLGLNLDFTFDGKTATAIIPNSNTFSSIYAKLSNIPGLDVVNENITLSGLLFEWDYFEDNADVPFFFIKLEGSFVDDTYEVTVWQK